MPLKALLFAVLGQICVIGLIASSARPAWFRINGTVPSRWKIGGFWLALALVCAVGALGSSADLPPIEFVETTPVEAATTDIAMPIDIAVPADTGAPVDFGRSTEDAAHIAIDAAGVQDASRPADRAAAARPSVRR